MPHTGLKDLINIADTYAEIEMPFQGTAVNGMLLWLDENLMKKWCQLNDARIDPQPGGMFYLTWTTTKKKENHAVFGVIDEINTETNSFKVTKIICVTDESKLTGLELNVSFGEEMGKNSSIKVRLTHNFDPYIKLTFDRSVQSNWPKTFNLFKEFIEN
jgi:hypothetical protein